MSVRREFTCNLCRTPITSNPATDRAVWSGVGIFWGTGDKIEFRPVAETENHLCKRCVLSIKEAQDVGTGERFPPSFYVYTGSVPPK